MGGESYCGDIGGEKRDAAIHEAILNNASADLLCRKQSFKRAVINGMPRDVAKQLYGADADCEE